jgi:hypothetical protein
MPTTTAFRYSFAFALLSALGATTADARPKRVAVLDFEGKRAVADQGKAAIVGVLSDDYNLVSSKTWLEAKAAANRKLHGPQAWSKAARQVGVDAVIEGWINEEGRSKVLTIVITDASNGEESDQLTIKLGRGFDADIAEKIRKGIEERFEWIDGVGGGNPAPLPEYKVKDKTKIGARPPADDMPETDDRDDRGKRRDDDRDDRGKRRDDDRDDRSKRRDTRRSDRRDDDRDDRDDRRDRRDDRDDRDEGETVRVAKIEPKETKAEKEQNLLASVFKPVTEEEDIVTGGKASHVPKPTPKFNVAGGFFYGSRTLYIGAENPDGVTQYAGVPSKGIGIDASFFPFPTKKIDGIQSGIGFSFGVGHSLGSKVTYDDLEEVGDYVINQTSWNAGIHYRAPLGSSLAIQGSVGYGQDNYVIEDAPMTFEVPNTAYSYLSAGGHVDLSITERSTVGFGAKYLYMLGTGDLSSVDWYGPGGSGGWHLDGNFSVPLPSNMFVRGELSYTRIKTTFDGVGTITEAEAVSEAVDSTVSANVKVGISF